MQLLHRLGGPRHIAARKKKLSDFYDCCNPTCDDRVLDVGVLGDEYYEFANSFLHAYRHPNRLTVLGVEDLSALKSRYPKVNFVTYDGYHFPFRDNEFDVCHSNAVIEHVGDFERQRLFLGEMVRVARRGFFTTPNRWFPVELHTKTPFLHYLPRPLYLKTIRDPVYVEMWRTLHLLDIYAINRLLDTVPLSDRRIIRNRFALFTATFSVYWRK